MSNVYLLLALIGTFGTVTAVMSVLVASRAGRAHTVRLLEAQVQPVPVSNVREPESLRRALPDTMDLLTISVEAGLGFDAALAQVVEHVPGALSEEIGRLLQEIQLGKPRADALRALGERSSVDELDSFVLAIIQADVF